MAKHSAAWWDSKIVDVRAMVRANKTIDAYLLAKELYQTAQSDYSEAADAAQVQLVRIMDALNQERYGKNPLTRIKKSQIKTKPSQLTGLDPDERLIKRRRKTAAQPMPGVYANPLTRVKVTSPSQREHMGIDGPTDSPTQRLRTRRKTTKDAPPGFFANPAAKAPRVFYWILKSPHYDGSFLSTAYSESDVVKIAQQKADKYGAQVKITRQYL